MPTLISKRNASETKKISLFQRKTFITKGKTGSVLLDNQFENHLMSENELEEIESISHESFNIQKLEEKYQ